MTTIPRDNRDSGHGLKESNCTAPTLLSDSRGAHVNQLRTDGDCSFNGAFQNRWLR